MQRLAKYTRKGMIKEIIMEGNTKEDGWKRVHRKGSGATAMLALRGSCFSAHSINRTT